jgi:hypothetical protein
MASPLWKGILLGSKNIPADADKVQVLRNFNEVSQMKGLETTTMILRLTSNSKKR